MNSPKEKDTIDIVMRWWYWMTSEKANGHASSGAKRAALARLRRAKTPLEVIQEPEALRLIAQLPDRNAGRAAILAGVLAFVREDEKQPVARAIGRTRLDEDGSALMSEGRFRRLLQADEDERMSAMRRLVRLKGGKANVKDLSRAILYWGDGIKKRWIFGYYNVFQDVSEGIATRNSVPHAPPAT